MAPEYAIAGVFSTKIDIFSFGVLLIEILSGKKNNGRFDLDRPLNLVGYVSFSNYLLKFKTHTRRVNVIFYL